MSDLERLKRGSDDRTKKVGDRITKAIWSAATATFLTVAPAGEPSKFEAAERPAITWSEVGYQYRAKTIELKNGKTPEHGRNIIFNTDGTMKALPFVVGTVHAAGFGRPALAAQAEEILKVNEGKQIDHVCFAHNHTLWSTLKEFFGEKTLIDGKEILPFHPPSPKDVSVSAQLTLDQYLLKKIGIARNQLIKIVFDAHGAWYHRLLDPKIDAMTKEQKDRANVLDAIVSKKYIVRELEGTLLSLPLDRLAPLSSRKAENSDRMPGAQHEELRMNIMRHVEQYFFAPDLMFREILSITPPKAQTEYAVYVASVEQRDVDALVERQKEAHMELDAFVRKSGSPAFDFESEYAKLQAAYLRGYNVKVRFVSYEDMGKEQPPCRGVDVE